MAQLNWNVRSHAGRQYTVGVYHGQDSGHLVVHCNSKVILIDFNVLHAKTYSFMLDNNLCELSIQPKGQEYDYSLDLNDPPPPPVPPSNPGRYHNYYALGAALIFFLAIYLLTVWLSPYIPQ